MNCLFSKPLREKLELRCKIKGGEIVFYLSCSLFSPSPDSVASNQSRLLSSSFLRHSPAPRSLSTVSHLQCGKVQLEMFLKQTTLLWSKHLFLKDCFTNNAVKYICFCKFKIIQINLPWVFAIKRNKSQANSEWRSRACCRSRHGSRLCTPWTLALKRFLVTVHSVLSVPSSILNCSFFFPSLDKPGLCMLQVHCFVPLPPSLEELPMQIKMVRALDLQWCVFRWRCTGKEHPCPLEQENKQVFSIHKITVCIFYPWAEGDSGTGRADRSR